MTRHVTCEANDAGGTAAAAAETRVGGVSVYHGEKRMSPRGVAVTIRRLVVPSLGTWAAAWDELVDQAALPSPFLRSWWLNAVASKKAEYVLFLETDKLIGGLALERRRHVLGVPLYQFIGSGTLCPDHLDLLAERGKESIVRRATAEWFTEPGSRVLDLEGVVENSLLEGTFPRSTTTVIDVAPWAALPADGAEYLTALSPNLRKTVRRTQRRLLAAGVTHCRVASSDVGAATAALRDFAHLHELRGGRDALLREMPRLVPALITGLARGEVQIDILRWADRIVLVLISFRLGQAVRVYQSARLLDHELRDAESVVLVEVAGQASKSGCHELDLLRGNEPYKARFVQQKREVRRLRAAHGALGAVVFVTLNALTSGRRFAGRVRRTLRNQGGPSRAGRDQRGVGPTGRTRRRAAE